MLHPNFIKFQNLTFICDQQCLVILMFYHKAVSVSGTYCTCVSYVFLMINPVSVCDVRVSITVSVHHSL